MAHVAAAKQQAETPAPEDDLGQEDDAAPQTGGETPADPPDEQPTTPAPAEGPPALAIAAASAAESDSVLRFTASLSKASPTEVTVAYETEDDTATAGEDYLAARGRLRFPAESTEARQIEVRLLNDQLAESRETLTVRLSDPRGATLAAASATGTIQDDDSRSLAVMPVELFVTEGKSASYEVRLGSRPTAAVTVTVSTGSGELTVDPERLVFAPAQWSDAQQVKVTADQDEDALADTAVELAHTASGGGYDGVAGAAVTVTIVEDDVPTLALAPASVSEQTGRISFTVTLTLASDEAVTVDYATGADGDTATEGTDYTRARGTLRFPARSTARQTIAVTVTDDSLDEDDETLTVTLSNATNAQLAGGGATQSVMGQIEDEDPLPRLSIGDGSLTEGAGGGMRFEVQLGAASGRTVTVQYGTADVTAAGGADYTAATGTLTFTAGTTLRTVTIPIADDAVDEPDEQFTVTLRAAANATVATATGTGTISDNDSQPELSIGNGSLTEGSGDGNMVFAVRLGAASGHTVTVQYRTADGTATAGSDYSSASGTLTFRAGTEGRTVEVPIIDDALDEPAEQFTVTLQSAVNAALGTATGTGTIADNDSQPELSIGDGNLTEGDGSMPFEVRLSPASGSAVTVRYATADGTATAGADYTSASGALSFGAGATAATIDVLILDDTEVEATETFTVTLSSPSGATLSVARGTGTITDDSDTAATPRNGDTTTPPELSSLSVTGGATMVPAFDAGILHYAMKCMNSPTLTVAAATARDGATLTLLRADSADNVESSSGSLNANLAVDGDDDVAIKVSDGGESTTYVVHCLPDSFPTIEILTKTSQVKDGLLLLTPAYGGFSEHTTFMVVLDNNGVPRFHRQLTTSSTSDNQFWAMDFRPHGSGRFSVTRRPARNSSQSPFGNYEIELLDSSLAVTATLTTVSPLTQTDGHEFNITSAGDYVMLSYAAVRRDFSAHGGFADELVADSVIQRRSSAGTSQFTWNSWDNREVLQWSNDCKVGSFLQEGPGPSAYAHLNSLQVLSDGDYVASFRGCAQVLRIDGATGAVEWKLGGTAPPEGSTTEFLELVEHSNTDVVEEFCGQHHVTLTSSGTVVMFDNGVQCLGIRKNSASFSRAVEYDISSGTQAEYLREYKLPGSHGYFPYRGGVHVLDDFGGSVHWLISWGDTADGATVNRSSRITVSEVDPVTGTAHLEVNMSTATDDAWTYRAYRIPESEVDISLNLP